MIQLTLYELACWRVALITGSLEITLSDIYSHQSEYSRYKLRDGIMLSPFSQYQLLFDGYTYVFCVCFLSCYQLWSAIFVNSRDWNSTVHIRY